jgi:hypothetical protein
MTIGHVIRVDTTSTVDVAALANQIRQLLHTPQQTT